MILAVNDKASYLFSVEPVIPVSLFFNIIIINISYQNK